MSLRYARQFASRFALPFGSDCSGLLAFKATPQSIWISKAEEMLLLGSGSVTVIEIDQITLCLGVLSQSKHCATSIIAGQSVEITFPDCPADLFVITKRSA
jgi:hypothetical protein